MEVTAGVLARAESRWHKSRYSGAQGGCVEVAGLTEGVLVRDTKNREAGVLGFPGSSWSYFGRSFKQ
jgi:Domain of unknown function (DUF397)